MYHAFIQFGVNDADKGMSVKLTSIASEQEV